MPWSLGDSARHSTFPMKRAPTLGALESEQKLKEEAKGLAVASAGDVGVLQREKMVLKGQVKGEALVTFLRDVCSQFSNALSCLAWAVLQRQLSEVRGQLQSESGDHNILRATLRLVFNDLGVTPAMEMSSLTVRVT